MIEGTERGSMERKQGSSGIEIVCTVKARKNPYTVWGENPCAARFDLSEIVSHF